MRKGIRHADAEQRVWLEPCEAERPLVHPRRWRSAIGRDRRNEQRVHREDETRRESARDTGSTRAGPVNRGDDRGSELRHGGERQRPDGGKAGCVRCEAEEAVRA